MEQTYLHTTPVLPDIAAYERMTDIMRYVHADMLCSLHRLQLSGESRVPALRTHIVALSAALRRSAGQGTPAGLAALLMLEQDITQIQKSTASPPFDESQLPSCLSSAASGCPRSAESLVRLCQHAPVATRPLQEQLHRCFAGWAAADAGTPAAVALDRAWVVALWLRTFPADATLDHAIRQSLRRHAAAAEADPAARIALHRLICELDDAPHPDLAAPLRSFANTPAADPELRAAARAELLRHDMLTRIACTEAVLYMA